MPRLWPFTCCQYFITTYRILQLVDTIATKITSQSKSYEKQSFKFQVQMVNTTGIGNEGMAITLDNSRVVLPPDALNPPSVVISTLSVSKVSLFGGSNSSVFPETNILSVSILGQRVANLKSKIQLVIRKTEVSDTASFGLRPSMSVHSFNIHVRT